MQEAKELTVKIKFDDEVTIRKKFLIYDPLTVSCEDSLIKSAIEETKGDYKGSVESVKVIINFEVI